jgi:hypothetical protein
VRMSLYAPPLFHFCFPLLPSNLSSHLLTQLATSYMRCKELYGSNVQHLVIRPPQLQRTSPLERASSRLPAALLCTPPGVYKSSGRTSKAAQYSPATSSSTVPARTVPLHQTPLCSLLSYLARLNTIVYPRSSVYPSILSYRHVRVRASRAPGSGPLHDRQNRSRHFPHRVPNYV